MVIKTNKKIILPILIGMILLSKIFFSNIALAIPGIPNQFYGSVAYNGQPAPDGLSVVSKINGLEVSSTTTSDGKYGYSPVFYVEDPNNDRSGETINFFVNGVDTGQTAIFCNGCSTRLDLTATGTTVTTPSDEGSSSSSSSGTSKTTTTITEQETITTTIIQSQECREKWTCTEWSSCENSVQTRTCTDENNCGTDLYKPFESQPCATVEMAEEQKFSITGLLTSITTPIGLGLIIVVIIAIILFIIKRKPSEKE